MNEFEKAVRDALVTAARRGGTGPENYATANVERVAADLRAALFADEIESEKQRAESGPKTVEEARCPDCNWARGTHCGSCGRLLV